MNIKTLSLRQPWAGFILTGKKTVENRQWSDSYNGPILIHASKTWDVRDLREFYELAEVPYFDNPVYRESWYSKDPRFASGAVVGIAMKGPCVPPKRNPTFPPTLWHDVGAVWWPIAAAVPLVEPIPVAGKPYLFSVEVDGSERLDHPGIRTIKQYIKAYTTGVWIR